MPEEQTLTQSDRQAIDCVQLALLLLTSKTRLTTAQIITEIYSTPEHRSLKPDSLRRKLTRNLEDLARIGVHVVTEPVDGELTYRIDAETTLADKDDAPATDTLEALAAALTPLVSTDGFAGSEDLSSALMKLSLEFSTPLEGVMDARNEEVATEKLVKAAIRAGRAVELRYVPDGADSPKTYTVEPYGLYGLQSVGHIYLVGRDVGADGDRNPKTFRLDRVRRVKLLKDRPYVIPDGFDIKPFVRTPFQIGPTVAHATLRLPNTDDREFRPLLALYPTRVDGGSTVVADVPVSNIDLAAAWCFMNGVRPLAPSELVAAHDLIPES